LIEIILNGKKKKSGKQKPERGTIDFLFGFLGAFNGEKKIFGKNALKEKTILIIFGGPFFFFKTPKKKLFPKKLLKKKKKKTMLDTKRL